MENLLAFILLFSAVIIIISFYATNLTGLKPNRNILLCVTLPVGCHDHPEVLSVLKAYKRATQWFFLALALLFLPVFLLPDSISVVFSFYFLWIGLTLIGNTVLLGRYNKRLLVLKEDKGWKTGEERIVRVDTEVVRVKDKMPVSKLWYIPSFLIGALPLFMAILRGDETDSGWLIGISVISINLIFLICHYFSARERTYTVCSDTQINLAYNRVSRRLWSMCWVILSLIESTLMTVLSLFLNREESSELIITLLAGLSSLISLVVVMYVYSKIRKTRNALLSSIETPIYTDEDRYWVYGFYNNPNDKHVFVEKRVGYGFTLNMASLSGKLITIVFPLVLIGGLIVFMSILDNVQFGLTFEGNTVNMQAPFYSYSFQIDEIQEITIMDTLPGGTRTNGAATSQYSLGNFKLKGYGASKLYVYNENPPYIFIKLSDLYIVVNGRTEAQSQEYLKLLNELVPLKAP